jgi:hypothetical protein
MKPTQKLHNLGQSLWLDNTMRDLLNGGTIKLMLTCCATRAGCALTMPAPGRNDCCGPAPNPCRRSSKRRFLLSYCGINRAGRKPSQTGKIILKLGQF